MTAIAPSTDIYLLKLPIELDDENQLTFASASAQATYFQSLTKTSAEDTTYQRRDETIRYPAGIDSILQYNYVMYKNVNYSKKWFYARITNMAYVGDEMTAISIEEDTFQTWQFDLVYSQCFVEREHVNDDTIGANTIDEGLELGEYTVNSSDTIKPDKVTKDAQNTTISRIYPIFFQVTQLASGISIAESMFESSYNGIFSGLYFFAVTSEAAARSVIARYAGHQEDIVAIFLAPKEYLDGANVFGELGYNIYIPKNQTVLSSLVANKTITRPSTLNGYTPKNQKLFCWPFSYVSVTNNAGINTEFKFEDFLNATPIFMMSGAIGQGCTTKLCPVGYKGSGANVERFDYGIVGAKYPICGWASDYYTNWCVQNAVNTPVKNMQAITGTAANLATGNIGGIIGQIGGLLSERHQAKLHPDQAMGDTNSSDILIGWQRYFTVNCMSVRAEIARSIDEYLSAYGYKVNRIKTPNTQGRTNWNFVKTVGSAIHAYIPQNAVDKINKMFDNGITLWHNASTFRDYSQSNTIVTPTP